MLSLTFMQKTTYVTQTTTWGRPTSTSTVQEMFNLPPYRHRFKPPPADIPFIRILLYTAIRPDLSAELSTIHPFVNIQNPFVQLQIHSWIYEPDSYGSGRIMGIHSFHGHYAKLTVQYEKELRVLVIHRRWLKLRWTDRVKSHIIGAVQAGVRYVEFTINAQVERRVTTEEVRF